MPMNEELLKVRLSPARGQFAGTFTEGMPVAEALGGTFAFQIDGTDGERIRRYGVVSGVHDNLLNIDNKQKSSEQVMDTTIYFLDADPLVIVWRRTAVAVAEIAMMPTEKSDG
jgi:hypothetical protein